MKKSETLRLTVRSTSGSFACEEQGNINEIKEVAGDKWNVNVFYHGRLPNEQAIEKMKFMDIISLPTYYRSETFPMSIIEYMSLTKLVISRRRTAIPDILTDNDGGMCGILVEERCSKAITTAIKWCQDNSLQADVMCRKAYEKVYNCYRKEVVYEIYRKNYQLLKRTCV